jgi:2-polyprenyl-3-methyl-5-hydroxy-6-metoxy-1,4-benzoquinol methylase
MNSLSHVTAKPSHYNSGAEHYDGYNEKNSTTINQLIKKILKKHRAKTVLDLTCGTGSQVFWLAKRGFKVVGSDFNSKMLEVAKSKARKSQLDVQLLRGDMRTLHVGEFDAVITIFNAVGHLTQADFEKSMRNIHKNLKPGGIYVFDIFNLSYLLKHDHIRKLTIDWQQRSGSTTVRDIQYSTVRENGVLASYNISHVQKGTGKPRISRSAQTLQIYTSKQLKEMLSRNGFRFLGQYAADGSRFNENRSERIVMIAKKI